MTDIWDQFPDANASAARNDPWAAFPDAAAKKPESFSGTILPLTRDATGLHFDSNAGLIGMAKRAFTLPADVSAGKVDPMSPEGQGRVLDLAGMATPLGVATRARTVGGGLMPRSARPAEAGDVPGPSVEALKSAASGGYDAARAMGVDYSPEAVKSFATQIKLGLENDGVLAELAPKTHAILNKLSDAPAGPSVVPFGGLEAARRAFGNAAKDFNNPTDQMAARRAVSGIDEFMSAPPSGATVSGNAEAAAAAVTDARGNYGAAKRAEKLQNTADSADLNAAVANSGRNIDNAIRQRARDIIDPRRPERAAGYSADERAAIEDIARGNATRNAVRYLSHLFGGGGGLGQFMTGIAAYGAAGNAAAGSTGAAVGVMVPAAGAVLKSASNAMTTRAMDRVIEQTAKRSPLYEQMLREAGPVSTGSPDAKSMLFRLLELNRDPQAQRQ